jgi:hypothetical protein
MSENIHNINGRLQIGSPFIMIMYRIAVVLVLIGIALIVINAIWKLFRKPISKLLPVKKVRVEVIRMVPRDQFRYTQKMDLVIVRFQKSKRKKQRKFWMKGVGIREGDRGVLTVQGVFGINFEKEDSALKDQISIYQKYDFAKKKKMDSAENENKKIRKNRKYW